MILLWQKLCYALMNSHFHCCFPITITFCFVIQGKFIRIHFGTTGKIAGADIEFYLLEKSRVTSQMAAERNYHIFYQLLSPAFPELHEKLLVTPDAGLYSMINQGVLTVDGIDDVAEMKDCWHAFEVLGFSADERLAFFKCTASILHFGEMKFKQRPREEQAEADGTAEAEKVCCRTLLTIINDK